MSEAGVPQDRTLVEVIDDLRAEGFDADFWTTEDGLRCSTCRGTTPAERVEATEVRRVEGASDPGDEAIVIGTTCVVCGAKGVAALRFGPEAGPEDAGVLQAIDLPAR